MKRQPKQIADYRHTQPATEQEPDPRPGNYYVSVVDRSSNAGHGRTGLLLGPFASHAEALANQRAATDKAQEVCSAAIWYAFGTVRMADDYTKPGVLNKFFPELFASRDIVTA